MKLQFITAVAIAAIAFTSCKKDDTTTVTIDSAQPNGAFTATRAGNFVAQNGTPTQGKAEVGTDASGVTFLHFASNFKTEQGTGTTSVFLSTSATYTANPGAGNPDLQLAGIVRKDGEVYYKMNGPIAAKFTHVVLWCASANVQFGNAKLQ